ncbi:hypothetical protein EV179_001760 [Coemansia sp. RSA 487]|nr:hypothetical protein LPJ74_002877 [Coemansia sp. RSA 1843]KAJ2215932.1 hypothetical protein EV179_001760 [Coemansia sp. RSA 487]
MAFFLGTTPVENTARYVCAYLDDVTGFSHALDLQTREPGLHERHTSLTLFHARSVPTINLEAYTLRILKYCPFQNEVLLGLIVYLQQMVDRCAQRRVPFTVDAYSIHRLIVTGVTIGSKWFSDVFFTNSRYAKVGGLSVAELNNLELQFLSIIDFDLNIQPEVLQAVGTDLFAGRLPRLTNAPYPADPVYNQHQFFAYQPATAYAQPAPNQQPAAYYHDRQRQVPYQQQRALKSMSYPGPNGAYYINPHDQAYKYSKNNAAIPVGHQKHAYPTQNASGYDTQDPSSGSTLASSPPQDAVHDEQLVDILHNQANDNTCLRVTDKRFSTSRRDTPSYSKLLAISNIYGYVVAGTPSGLSVFKTADALDALSKGTSKGTNTAVTLDSRKDVSLASYGGKPTHVDISADGLSVVVATSSGQVLVFSASSLVERGSNDPERTISVGSELRDLRANPLDAPTTVAALQLSGELMMLDIANGSCRSIFKPKSDKERITSICWSRKGKQIVCGDTSATLTQRLPTDGTAKRIIEPQADDGNILDEFSVLAMDWIDTYTFFVVYGIFPDGGFIAGNGGGGTGVEDDGDNDGIDDNMTAAYVVTQENKKAPMQWMYIEDPCSSMMRPERYPGFQIACISNWGASAKNIVIMAGTSSDVTMTIGHVATSKAADGSADESSAQWAQWDIDGNMAVMPLTAVGTSNDSDPDTFSIGIAIDYTNKNDLPPVSDDGNRVGPVPILWILNTDGCLLAYHIYNVFEMRNGRQCPDMVSDIKQLPGSTSSDKKPFSTSGAPVFGSSASAETKLPAFASKPVGGTGTSAFGFGKSNQASSMPKGPTASGVSGQPVFGGGPAHGGFGGFGQTTAAGAPGGGKSIFDAPSSGPSIFGASAAASGDSSGSMFKPYVPTTQTTSSAAFGSAFAAKPGNSAPTAAPKQTSEQPEPAASVFGSQTGFGGFGKSLDASLPVLDKQDSNESRPVASAFGGPSAFGGIGISSNKSAPAPAPAVVGSEKPKLGAGFFGGSSSAFGGFGTASKLPEPSAKPTFDSGSNLPISSMKKVSWGPNSQANLSDVGQQMHEKAERANQAEQRKEQEKKEKQEETQREQRKEQEKQEATQRELRKEQERKEAMERELEMKTGEVIRKQYILTCNRFDRELHAFGSSLKKTESAIAQVRSSRLPPIAIDPSVEHLASLTRRMDEMSIDDTNAWNTVADCLLEALQVSRDELKASQKLLSKQISDQLKMETKREEISRILETSMSTRTTSSSTFDGGLNPIQRDYQRRLKRAFNMIGKRTKDVEQVVDMEAERLESRHNNLPLALRAPTTDSIQRTLSNVSRTLDQKNEELGKLAACIDAMDLGNGRSGTSKPNSKPKPKKRQSFSSDLASNENATKATYHTVASSIGGPAAALRTAASGTPWSPHNLPLNLPLGKHNRGFGLRPEDLVVSDTPASNGPGAVDASSAPKSNPLFPNAQIRELVPRSAKSLRKTSIVLDDDAASASTASGFSNAAAYSHARKQRSVVHDVLTRSNRSAAVFRTPESAVSRAYKFGGPSDSAVPKQTPMPNLERYVKAFGKLKIDEPESEYESDYVSESEPEQELVASQEQSELSFGGFKESPRAAGSSFGMPHPKAAEDEFKPLGGGMFDYTRQGQSGLVFGASKESPNPAARPLFGGLQQKPLEKELKPVVSGSTLFATARQESSGLVFGESKDSPKLVGRSLFGGSQKKSLEDEFKPLDAASSPIGLRPRSTAATDASQGLPAEEKKLEAFGMGSFKPSRGLTFGALSLSSGAGGAQAPGSQTNEWTCEVCELKNPQNATKCTICDAQKPGSQPVSSKPGPASTVAFGGFKPSGGLSLGSVQSTSFSSASSEAGSVAKEASKPAFGLVLPPLQPAASKAGEWTCEVCELKSPQSATKCLVCDATKPGTSTAQIPKPAASGKPFGGFKPSAGLSFGSPSLASAKSVEGLSKDIAEPVAAPFGGFKPSGGLSFGSVFSKDAKEDTKPVFDSALVAAASVAAASVAASDAEHAPKTDSLSGHSSDYTDNERAPHHNDGSESLSKREDSEIVSKQKVSEEEGSEAVSENRDDKSDANSENLHTYAEVVKANVSEDEEPGHGIQSLDSEDEQTESVDVDSLAKEDDQELEDVKADDIEEDIVKIEDETADSSEKDSEAITDEKKDVETNNGKDADSLEEVPEGSSTDGAESSNSPHMSEPEEKPEQDHDSDGFVHVSQLESGHESKEDVSSTVIHTETSAEPVSSSATESLAQLLSELGQQLSGVAADQLVDRVFSAIEKDAKAEAESDSAPEKEDEQSALDAKEAKEESQQSEARTSDDFVVLSQTASIDDVTAASDSKSESNSNSASAFGLDDIAKEIDAVSSGDDDAVSSDNESDMLSDEEPGVSSASSSAPPVAQFQLEQSKASGTSSFFKSGRLGSFGAFGGKSSFGSGQASPSLTGSDDGNKALPNAFASGSQKPAAVPAFGAKLDRPAFGVASMSTFGANKRMSSGAGNGQGSFASIGNIPTGFGARGSASADPFAKYREASAASPAADASSIFSKNSRESSPDISIRPTKPLQKVVATTAVVHDPIRAIIDDELGDDNGASDSNGYDSD